MVLSGDYYRIDVVADNGSASSDRTPMIMHLGMAGLQNVTVLEHDPHSNQLKPALIVHRNLEDTSYSIGNLGPDGLFVEWFRVGGRYVGERGYEWFPA